MDTYQKNIVAGTSMQWAVGDNRKDAYILGTYTATRGQLRQSGRLEIDSLGAHSSSFVGADCGITIDGSLSGNKILIKATVDSMDAYPTSFKMKLTKSKI